VHVGPLQNCRVLPSPRLRLAPILHSFGALYATIATSASERNQGADDPSFVREFSRVGGCLSTAATSSRDLPRTS
jgi:hypothetical protein